MKQVSQAGRLLEEDDRVRVIVFQSANPEFFIAHADVEMIRRISDFEPSSPSGFQRVVERYRTMEKISIGKIEGCVGCFVASQWAKRKGDNAQVKTKRKKRKGS